MPRPGELAPPAAARELLASLQQGAISPAAYDTAFVARLRQPDDPETLAYPQTLNWLLRSQNADGGFGTTLPIPKEKLISTLSAVLALADLPQSLQDGAAHRARAKALRFLYEDTGNWQTGPDTAGFELVLPALLDEAKVRELPLPYERFMGISAQRDAKIGHIPPRLIYNVKTPLLHSLEYLGNRIDVEAARKQLSPNGSFANSPSATAYFMLKTRDEQANEYIALLLRNRGDGSIPTVAPFEVFEIAWVLYNLARADQRPAEAQPLVRYLAQALTDDGVGVSREGLRADADDTALTLSVLHRYGYPISAGPLRPFEGINFFFTFPLERDASVTTNAHVLEVLHAVAPFPRQHVIQQKVLKYLRDARVDGDHWVDKWHGSPFYATAHAVFALTAPAPDACLPAYNWLRNSQREDGSWGWFSGGTPEETAYAVQALMLAPAEFRAGMREQLGRAAAYLNETEGEPVIPMWVGKTLYGPTQVVRSAVLSARILLARSEHARPAD
ncbi:MAG TPA: prenyltransferase/squalene oxidase repeat-containing protein [Candidatus Dormibacteraeota bacterium]|nr:prenyltransferase/squalene oxidase repeat-containing protein [Candidatus Dormibacteraeota bacterium]